MYDLHILLLLMLIYTLAMNKIVNSHRSLNDATVIYGRSLTVTSFLLLRHFLCLLKMTTYMLAAT